MRPYYITSILLMSFLTINLQVNSQVLIANNYNVHLGENNGIQFGGGSGLYSIKMGNTYDFHFGHVTGLAIKNSMSGQSNGWTWGVYGKEPIASLNTDGYFDLAGNIEISGYGEIQQSLQVHHWAQFGTTIGVGGNSFIIKPDYNGITACQFNSDALTFVNWQNTEIVRVFSDNRIEVNGKLTAETVEVIADVEWPDYVFSKDYSLMSLTELKSFVDKNNHLPDVPTAYEIAEEGINLGEMNVVLLKKVEELTLYIIDLQVQIDELKMN